jgi:predicted DCC family thiol-disulfide oxidoreductase YuxK
MRKPKEKVSDPKKPVIPAKSIILFYDADCGLCEGVVRLLIEGVPKGRVEAIPYQSANVAKSYPEVLEHADKGFVCREPTDCARGSPQGRCEA